MDPRENGAATLDLAAGCRRSRHAQDSGGFWIGGTGRDWRSACEKNFCLQRIRWDGKTMPVEMLTVSLTKTGFLLRFTMPVDHVGAATRQ